MSAVLLPSPGFALPPRWTVLRPHPVQHAYWNSPHRFNTLPAGRRSGKTELFKRKVVKRALAARTPWAPRYFAGAPTRDQAKRIFWEDLKLLSDPQLVDDISESDLMIRYINAATLWVVGMDKPERVEGQPWDGGGLDEIANMKPQAWGANVRPALSDRMGWCDLLGVPEGRNHYYELDRNAKAQMAQYGSASEWGSFSWPSSDILPASEIEAARRDLDELTFQQEYEASFINFAGRAYYVFDERIHASLPLLHLYDPKKPLRIMFDFNVEPGVAAVGQEVDLPNKKVGTAIFGEVWIPRNSNTPAVCRRLMSDWGPSGKKHQGQVICYGDATGGARGTAQTQGSDWDLIKSELSLVWKNQLSFRVKTANPKERSRINATNSRLKSADGTVRLMIDPVECPHLVRDFEGVTLLVGGSGEIDKKIAPDLTHLTDSVGYYCDYEFPIESDAVLRIKLGGV